MNGRQFVATQCRLLLLLILASLVACTRAPDYAPVESGATVVAFGDSVSYGTGGDGENYPALLAGMTGWQVINGGIPGDTARRARDRIGPLLDTYRPALVIVELGGNDFLRQYPEKQVKEDLRAIVRAIQEAGAVPVLLAVPRLSLLRATTGSLSDADLYADLAGEESVLLIEEVFSAILSDASLRADPIHPNARGYQVLAEGILARLQEAGLIL